MTPQKILGYILVIGGVVSIFTLILPLFVPDLRFAFSFGSDVLEILAALLVVVSGILFIRNNIKAALVLLVLALCLAVWGGVNETI